MNPATLSGSPNRVSTAAICTDAKRCTITTNDSHAQIGAFYAGALANARKIDLAASIDCVGGIELVLMGPHEPEAMLRHTQVCREVAPTPAADPSGVGYGFRAGFRAAVAPGLSLERAAHLSCMVAPVIEVQVNFFACGPGSHH